MRESRKKKTDLEERLGRSADAKKALLERFKPKPAVAATEFVSREERKARELEAVRLARAEAKEAARLAKEQAEEQKRQEELLDEEAQLAAQRAARKARKADAKEQARLKREANQAVRETRKVSGGPSADPWAQFRD